VEADERGEDAAQEGSKVLVPQAGRTSSYYLSIDSLGERILVGPGQELFVGHPAGARAIRG
jgi:hypothetical protein